VTEAGADSAARTPDAEAFERCMAVGGIALFPSDTVYGLACDVASRVAVERLYLLKRRPLVKPSAVMFFDLDVALEAVPELGERTRAAMDRLLPGAVTLLVPNPGERFPLACGDDPGTLGLRVPAVERLAGVRWPVLQSSANKAGGPDPRGLEEVPQLIRSAADLVIDGGVLPGAPSTVVDLRTYDTDGSWSVVRHGAVQENTLRAALGGQFHFDPSSYLEMIRGEVPLFDRLQDELVGASDTGVRRILELGTGTGETARRLLARHPDAMLVGIDESQQMLAAAGELLPPGRVELRVGRLEEELPVGPFDLVASALCVHHLDAAEKRALFVRIRAALAPGGRFVLADVVVPERAADAVTPLTPGFDKPSSVAEQLTWLADAGLDATVVWADGDLAVLVGTT
jgi:tRNA threonylcarbamoyl adenosine modification protein (Sua5/YciO/YrdC/YwlC family)